MPAPAIPFSSEMVDFLESPVAVQVAACSPSLRPSSTRGFGCVVESDRRTLRLAVNDAQAERCLEDLGRSDRLSVNLSHVADFRGIQVKGRLLEMRPATAAEVRAAETYFTRLVEVIGTIGVSSETTRGFWKTGPMRILRVEAEALFEQTPGPRAGEKLETTWKRL